MRKVKLLSIDAAAEIAKPFVYGLHDKSGLFYVGKANKGRYRFVDHFRRPSNPHLARRLKSAGKSVMVEVIALDPEDISQAEADAIALNCANLVNIARNPFRLPTGFHTSLGNKSFGPPCPICDQPMKQSNSRQCADCLTKILSPKGSTKAQLRALLACIPRT